MIQSKDNMDKLIEELFPTSKEELLKDIMNGDYDTEYTKHFHFSNYVNKKLYRLLRKTNDYDHFDWGEFFHYYLSDYINVYIETNLIERFGRGNNVFTVIYGKNNRSWYHIKHDSNLGKEIIQKLQASNLENTRSIYDHE